MLCRMFQAHGEMCVSHPWEVILAGISAIACLMSMSLFASVDKISSSIHSSAMEEPGSSDLIIITFTRCVAVLYIYLQFRNLRKLGSNYLLGIAVAFSTLSIFVFSIMVLSIMGSNLSGIWEALPFFVLLMDLSRVITLGRSALSSTSPSQVSDNIASSMALLGPTVTLDAIVQTLVIGIGTLSGVEKLEMICGFGCLSVIANYVAFMTFYPACLILVLQLSIGQQKEPAEWQITEKREDEQLDKPNPVTLRVKIIMSAGLVLVHAHSRWVTAMAEKMAALEPHSADRTGYISPDMPLWQVYLTKTFASSVDYSITLALAVILAAKYKFFDYEVDIESTVTVKRPVAPLVTRTSEGGTLTNLVETPCHTAQATDMSEGCLASKPSFIIGDGESEHSEESRTDAKEMVSVDTQTDPLECGEGDSRECTAEPQPPRSLEECVHIMKTGAGAGVLTDKEVLLLLENRELKGFQLESALGDKQRAVNVRRKMVSNKTHCNAIYNLPHKNYDYEYVHGACCENVIGYMPIPVGITGPLLLDGKKYMVPMATTEGTLVASTNRGCSAITASGGVKTMVNTNGMTRAPVVRFPSAQRAHTAKLWLEDQHNFDLMVLAFNSTSRYGRLQKLHVVQAARSLYIRFVAYTGDAMGMNMVSKGSEKVLQLMRDKYFEDMEILSLSGNFCSDKKPSAVNWLEGRGKSVVCDAVIPGNIVKSTLKTSVPALVDLYINKNLVGSAMAGSIGGFNAHAANIVAAIFIATGQDPAQVVCSSYCLTVMEPAGVDGEDLYISCTMPSLEVGTVGGGTVLPPQAACLEMLGVRGSSKKEPGANALQLARVICGTVLAGELSLMSALAAGHLVRSHLKHNRSSINMAPVSDEPKAEGSIVLPSISKKMRDKGKDLAACVHGVS